MATSRNEFKDEEDRLLEASPEFWQMIQERRRRPAVPLEEVEERLFADLNDDDENT